MRENKQGESSLVALVSTVAFLGLEARGVEVQVQVIPGLAQFRGGRPCGQSGGGEPRAGAGRIVGDRAGAAAHMMAFATNGVHMREKRTDEDWEELVKGMLKGELKRRGVTAYPNLRIMPNALARLIVACLARVPSSSSS